MYFSIKQFQFWRTLAFIVRQSDFEDSLTVTRALHMDESERLREACHGIPGSHSSATGHKINHYYEERDNQQKVNKTSGQMKTPSKKPQNDQDGKKGPEH